MGSSKPIIRTHDVPITEPFHPPKALPSPDPKRFAPDYSPSSVPAKEPVRVRPFRKKFSD